VSRDRIFPEVIESKTAEVITKANDTNERSNGICIYFKELFL
jgi:hypothetical protein